MPEQPQWSERTLDMPPQDPWADQPTAPGRVSGPAPAAGPSRTSPFPPVPPSAPSSPFSRGRAQVNPHPATQPIADRTQRYAEHEPTGTGWPDATAPARSGLSWRGSELRRGGEWTSAAALFAFVCWGIWAISSGGPLTTPVIIFLVTLGVAAGVFFLARLVGHLVLERWLGRTRRSARGSHLLTALFLAGVGVADLQQTKWVMDAVHWVQALGWIK